MKKGYRLMMLMLFVLGILFDNGHGLWGWGVSEHTPLLTALCNYLDRH